MTDQPNDLLPPRPELGDLVRYTGPSSNPELWQRTSLVLRLPVDHDGHRYLLHDLEGLDRNTWQSLPQHLIVVARASYRPAGIDPDVEAAALQRYVREQPAGDWREGYAEARRIAERERADAEHLQGLMAEDGARISFRDCRVEGTDAV